MTRRYGTSPLLFSVCGALILSLALFPRHPLPFPASLFPPHSPPSRLTIQASISPPLAAFCSRTLCIPLCASSLNPYSSLSSPCVPLGLSSSPAGENAYVYFAFSCCLFPRRYRPLTRRSSPSAFIRMGRSTSCSITIPTVTHLIKYIILFLLL